MPAAAGARSCLPASCTISSVGLPPGVAPVVMSVPPLSRAASRPAPCRTVLDAS